MPSGGFWFLDQSCRAATHTVTVAPTRQKHFKVPVKMKYEFVNFLKVVLYSEQNIIEICHGCVAKIYGLELYF